MGASISRVLLPGQLQAPADRIRWRDAQDKLARLEVSGPGFSLQVDLFQVVAGNSGKGAQVSARVVSWVALDNIAVIRNLSLDPGSANLLETFPASTLKRGGIITFSDQDAQVTSSAVYYWLKATPQNKSLQSQLLGPVSIGPGAGLAVNYGLIRVLVIPSSGTYAPTSGARALYVELVGGGGQGGGAAVSSSSLSAGGGGGGGGYAAVFLSGAQIKTSYSVTVGAGGSGAAAGASGNAGSSSSFDSPAVCTGSGGAGGSVMPAGTSIFVGTAAGGGVGGGGGSGSGPLSVNGGAGSQAVRLSAAVGMSGTGGPSFLGMWTIGPALTNPGNAAAGYGAGGSGAITTAAAEPGGAGANGVIRVSEFG